MSVEKCFHWRTLKNMWKVYFWAVGTIVGKQLKSFLLLNLGMKVKQSSSGCFFWSHSEWIQLDLDKAWSSHHQIIIWTCFWFDKINQNVWIVRQQCKMVGFICTAVQIILWLFVQQTSSVWYGFLPIWNLRKYLRVLAQGEGSPSPGLTLGVRMVLALIQSTLQWSNVKVQIRATCNQINDSKFPMCVELVYVMRWEPPVYFVRSETWKWDFARTPSWWTR